MGSGQKNFFILRDYLHGHFPKVADATLSRTRPSWVMTLEENRNLLTDRPCDPYVESMRDGNTEQFAAVCTALGVSRTSWLWQEIMLAYLRGICAKQDPGFLASVNAALDIADGKTELKPSATTSRDIIVALIRRYEAVSNRLEHPRLRDASLDRIGNPWLKRSAWDAWVANESSRRMVESWLKTRLIRDFFELLSDQSAGATDQRRLNYWLRFEPAMTDVRFALGSFALRNQSEDFKDLRKRMAGARAALEPSQGEMNNAFLMKIGSYVFIEFGVKGNACYFYHVDALPFDFNANQISIHQLKKIGKQQRSHVPSASWEQGFDHEFCALVGYWPDQANARPTGALPSLAIRRATTAAGGFGHAAKALPSETADRPAQTVNDLLTRCRKAGLLINDRTNLSGALWVRTDDPSAAGLKDDLIRLGFKFKEGRGYWRV